jgi:2-polyprenyl-3-methyl-5-hydroxy-6-metoxy-1,4-benzoquinol methylase
MKRPVYDPSWPELVKALHAHDMQEMWDAALAPHVFNMYHDELDRYLRIAGSTPVRILDVGCAQGTLALLLAEAGHHVVAVDLRSEFLEYARTRYEKGAIEFVQGNALKLNLPGPFDLIFANQILEHLVHPVELVRGLAGLLAPGGRLVATTPNGRYLKSKLPLFRELGNLAQYEDRQFFPDGDGHFFAYAANELQNIFGEAGLVQIRVVPYATPWITGHMKFRYLHGKVPVGLLHALDRALLGLPGLRGCIGYQLMASGRKPE